MGTKSHAYDFFLVASHTRGGQCASKTDKLLQSEDNCYFSVELTDCRVVKVGLFKELFYKCPRSNYQPIVSR